MLSLPQKKLSSPVSRGFTLIELMVTISILVIIVTVAVPSMRDWFSKNRVRAGAEELQNALRLAQAEAAKRNQLVDFVLVATRPPVSLGGINKDTSTANATSWVVRLVTDGTFIQGGVLPNGIKLSSGSLARLAFDGSGLVFTDPMTLPPTFLNATQAFRIMSSDNKFPLTVGIRSGGSTRICDPSATAGTALTCPSDM